MLLNIRLWHYQVRGAYEKDWGSSRNENSILKSKSTEKWKRLNKAVENLRCVSTSKGFIQNVTETQIKNVSKIRHGKIKV